MTGADVLELKNKLVEKGFYAKPYIAALDNEFDYETEKAVRKMQQAYSLTEDGVAGPSVIKYLNSDEQPVTPAAVSLGSRTLLWGMTGPDVLELKKKLEQKGYPQTTSNQSLNDRFDDVTEAAVKALQRANGLDVTGVVKEEVLKLLQ